MAQEQITRAPLGGQMPAPLRVPAGERRADASSALAPLLARVPAHVAVLRGPQHDLEWGSQTLLQGLGGGAVVGRPIAQSLHGRDAARVLSRLDAVRRSGQASRDVAVMLQLAGPDGGAPQPRCLDLTLQPLSDTDGAVDGVFLHGVDVTPALQAQQALEASEARCRDACAEAEQATRLKDEFLSVVSHEMRTPLAAIVGWSELLARGVLGERDRQAGVAAILRSAHTQAQLISDLLDLRGIETGEVRLQFEHVAAASAVEAAFETARQAALAREITLHTDIAPDAGSLVADPRRLQQAVGHLLAHAIKLTPRGESVSVAVRRAQDSLQIDVVDGGPGLEPESLPHVFDRLRPREAAAARRGGLGISLVLVRELVELHGGSTHAHSAGPVQGTRFRITLPLDGPAGARSRQLPRLDGVRVLVVDDGAEDRALQRRLLQAAGAQVSVAASAIEGFELLRRERPQLVLADVSMPEHDGYEFLRWVRGLHPDSGGQTPAAALSTLARKEDRERALHAGFQTHLVKPLDAQRLLGAVAQLAGRTAALSAA